MDYFRPDIVRGATSIAQEHGLQIDGRWALRPDWAPRDLNWSAVISHTVDQHSVLDQFLERGIPILNTSTYFDGPSIANVFADYSKCGVLAAEEFRQLGFQEVSCISSSEDPLANPAVEGFRSACELMGLQVRVHRPRAAKLLPDHAEYLKTAFDNGLLGAGLFCPHAGVAFDFQTRIQDTVESVVSRVAVISIDKDPQHIVEWTPIPLTAVEPNEYLQGYKAGELIHRHLTKSPIVHSTTYVPPRGITRRESTVLPGDIDPLVTYAKTFISQRFRELPKVEVVAAAAGISKRSLEVRFQKATGETVHGYITRLRIDEACRLLRDGEATIEEAARLLGYSSVGYFSNAFLREVGVRPGAYQRSLLNL